MGRISNLFREKKEKFRLLLLESLKSILLIIKINKRLIYNLNDS